MSERTKEQILENVDEVMETYVIPNVEQHGGYIKPCLRIITLIFSVKFITLILPPQDEICKINTNWGAIENTQMWCHKKDKKINK